MTITQVTYYYKYDTIWSEVKYMLFLKQQDPTFLDSL